MVEKYEKAQKWRKEKENGRKICVYQKKAVPLQAQKCEPMVEIDYYGSVEGTYGKRKEKNQTN